MKLPPIQLITPKPTATFVVMTKELVDELLGMNTKNRIQRKGIISTYQRAIEGGLWVPTNQGIGVTVSGFLVDGQHRLEALRAAGYPPVLMLLATGLPDAAMAAVDGGTNRTPRDYLQFMFDTKVSALVSAVLRTSMLASDEFQPIKYQPQEYATRLEMLGDSIREVMTAPGAVRLPAAITAALVDAHYKGYQSEVHAFTVALSTGEMLERDNPALVLRNWIANTKGHGGGPTVIERYRKTTRALQAWIYQRPLVKLYRTKSQLLVAQERAQKTIPQ